MTSSAWSRVRPRTRPASAIRRASRTTTCSVRWRPESIRAASSWRASRRGGAIALHAGLRFAHPLAGLIGLSTYLPLHDRALDEAAEANRQVRVLLAHGQLDPIVPFAWGEGTRDELQRVGCAVRWLAYPMQHEVCAEEVAAIDAWLGERLA